MCETLCSTTFHSQSNTVFVLSGSRQLILNMCQTRYDKTRSGTLLRHEPVLTC
jgi:hypothetical protein